MPELPKAAKPCPLELTESEYKTIKQYQSMGQTLDELRVYGYKAGRESIINRACDGGQSNGHGWLTIEKAAAGPDFE